MGEVSVAIFLQFNIFDFTALAFNHSEMSIN